MASGGTLCVAGAVCATVGRADGGVLAGVERAARADEVVMPDVDETADVDGTAEGVPVAPVAPPLVVEAQPASPSAAANNPIPIRTCLAIITHLAGSTTYEIDTRAGRPVADGLSKIASEASASYGRAAISSSMLRRRPV